MMMMMMMICRKCRFTCWGSRGKEFTLRTLVLRYVTYKQHRTSTAADESDAGLRSAQTEGHKEKKDINILEITQTVVTSSSLTN